MKYLKLFEGYQEKKSIEGQIEDILKKCKINHGLDLGDSITINSDGSIDVNYGIDLAGSFQKSNRKPGMEKITELPLLNGEKLFRNIYGFFDCDDNELTSLYGSPKSVGDFFSCAYNNITSLIGCPESIRDHFDCSYNKIRTLEGFPNHIGGEFHCYGNPVSELWELFKDKDKVELFNDFGITDGEVVILDRLNEFLEMIGKPIVTNTSDIENKGYKII